MCEEEKEVPDISAAWPPHCLLEAEECGRCSLYLSSMTEILRKSYRSDNIQSSPPEPFFCSVKEMKT